MSVRCVLTAPHVQQRQLFHYIIVTTKQSQLYLSSVMICPTISRFMYDLAAQQRSLARRRVKPKPSPTQPAWTSSMQQAAHQHQRAQSSNLTHPPPSAPPPPIHCAAAPLHPSTSSDSRSTHSGHVQAAHSPRVHSRRPFFRLPECPGSPFNSTQHSSSAAAHMAKTRLRD